MSDETVQSLLIELADEVEEPLGPPASRAWARAQRLRRRRVLGAAAAVVLAVVPVAVIQALNPAAVRPTPLASVPEYIGPLRVDHLPPTLESRTPSGWPATLEPPADAPTLAEDPAYSPVLLFQPNFSGPVYLYSHSGGNDPGMARSGWARVAVDLVETRDADGNAATPVDVNSLGPDAHLAFAQPDGYVVVDTSSGAVRRVPLPGLNEEVTWLPDGEHLLVSSGSVTTLAAADHVVGPTSVTGWDVAPLIGGDSGIVTMTVEDGDLVVTRWDDEGRTPQTRQVVNPIDRYVISYLTPRGWRQGGLIAQAASGQVRTRSGSEPGNFIVVVDQASRSVAHLLDLGWQDRNKGCCRVLGWLGTDTVIVATDQEGVLTWQLSTGVVTRALPPAPGVLSISPSGCEWEITVEGRSAACTT